MLEKSEDYLLFVRYSLALIDNTIIADAVDTYGGSIRLKTSLNHQVFVQVVNI